MGTNWRDRIKRAISLLLALYLLNFSVDSLDAQPDHVAEDLSYNDIESMYELILEAVLGIENAVEEHEEHDFDEERTLELEKIHLYPHVGYTLPWIGFSSPSPYVPRQLQRLSSLSFDIDGPPPRV